MTVANKSAAQDSAFTTRPEIVGTFGVVASTHWLASQTAMGIHEKGGTSFDAAVAGGFVDSAEFKAVYGASPTNAEIVTRLYDNVLHRPGETGGYNFWLGILDRGDGTVADVLAAFSESAENQAGVIGVISNGFAYTPVG